MTDENQNELDRELDAALAKYAGVQPRVGLEDRVLANLRARQAQVPERAWWRWIVVGALAATVVVALAVSWKSGTHHAPVIAHRPATAAPTVPQSSTQAASKNDANRKSHVRRTSPKVEIAAVPKLDQFPSARPLSAQEKILASYVEQYPERAVMLARARTEALQRDQLEEMTAPSSSGWASDSEDRNSETTKR